MKTFTLALLAMMATLAARPQVIESFDPITMHIMLGGSNDFSYISTLANPVPSGINTSPYTGMLFRDKDGVPWCGFWSPLSAPIDLTTDKYVHVKVWKPRISPVRFKIESGAAGTLEIESMSPQTLINEWEELVFDFSSKTGLYGQVVFMPDYLDPVGLTDDITIYFDDIFLNNDPTPGSAPSQMIENLEPIAMNAMLGGADDNSFFSMADNPDPGGINPSQKVGYFLRDKDGLPWGGFWSALPAPVDVTDNKYVHVKVYKPRISPLHFKIEGGAAGNLEIESTQPQENINQWEDMVFDFSSKTGAYPTIAFMPDFLDPVGLTYDIEIYFDDILVNDDPFPNAMRIVEINVDMRNSGIFDEPVYISGDFGGIWGVWNEPGKNLNDQMLDPDGDSVYSITMNLLDGVYAFKFFKGTGWGGGEWPGDPNRIATITCDNILNCMWGIYGFTNRKETDSPVVISLYPVPFTDYFTINSPAELSSVTISSLAGKKLLSYGHLSQGKIQIGPVSLPSGMYLVTCTLKTGERHTFKAARLK